MEIFSFIKPPLLHLLEISREVVSGIDKAVAIYYNEHSSTIQGKVLFNQSSQAEYDDLFLNDYKLIDRLRTQSNPFSWQTASNLPFETINESKVQLNIFDEFENVVLCLGFQNTTDQKNDLLFIYLNRNKGNFGLANSDAPLTTNEKNIIGQLVYKSFQAIYNQQINDSNVLKITNKRIANLAEQNEQLKEEVERLKNENKATKINIALQAVKEISSTYGVTFSFSHSASNKINQFNGSLESLKKSIKNSALYAININYGLSGNHIELNDSDLQLDSQELVTNTTNHGISERYHKTLHLLDKLEGAAKTVLDTNKKLTSENVGSACPIPISAPAISDALKNHHKKVRSLINEYPERWPIIKNEFRPIKNILISSTG